VNRVAGGLCVALGGWLAVQLLALLVDPALTKANLFTLPALSGGTQVAAKIGAFLACATLAAVLLGLGASFLLRPRSARLRRLALAGATQIVLALVLLEVALRVLVARDALPAAAFAWIANPLCGEAYSRYVARIAPATEPPTFDGELGWVHAARFAEGEGLPWPPVVDARPKAWFFGDSFMQGAGAPDRSPPALVERTRPERQSLNFGMSGYGIDQIVLSYERVAPRIPAGDPVYIGVLTVDLDRAPLAFFGASKPRWRLNDGAFTLEPAAPARARPDVHVASYALALVASLTELVGTRFDRSETRCAAENKEMLGAYALDRALALARERGHRLRWVVFAPLWDLHKPHSWRHDFLLRALHAREQAVVDGLAVLKTHAAQEGRSFAAYYIPIDGHLNDDGNAVLAVAMAASL
jgi:hypothetical protein